MAAQLDEVQIRIYKNNEMRFQKDKRYWFLYLLGGSVFGAIFARIVQEEGWTIRTSLSAAFILSIVLLGIVKLLSSQKDQLILSPRGFQDRRISKATISWKEVIWIKEFKITIKGLTAAKGLELRLSQTALDQVEKTKTAQNFWRMNTKINRKLGFGEIVIMSDGLDLSHDDLLKYFQRYILANAPEVETRL